MRMKMAHASQLCQHTVRFPEPRHALRPHIAHIHANCKSHRYACRLGGYGLDTHSNFDGVDRTIAPHVGVQVYVWNLQRCTSKY